MAERDERAGKAYRIILPLAIISLIVLLWRNGYAFGQWLYTAVH